MEPDSATVERQDRVIKALENRSPRLVGMYNSALNTLRGRSELRDKAAHVSVVCYCMRELMLNLPAAMDDSALQSLSSGRRHQSGQLCRSCYRRERYQASRT